MLWKDRSGGCDMLNQLKKDEEQLHDRTDIQEQSENSTQENRLPEFDEYGTALNDI